MGQRLRDFPVSLQLEGRVVLVVGAGEVATRRIEELIRYGARVRVVAPDATRRVRALADAGRLEWRQGELDEADLADVAIVFAATCDRDANRAVARRASRLRLLVNVADYPGACDFTMPAVARHGPLTLAVSTCGLAPALAAALRDKFASDLRSSGAAEVAESATFAPQSKEECRARLR